MATYTSEEFAAYNQEMRTIRSRVTFYLGTNTIHARENDILVTWNVDVALTDTINTPFDTCCADTCSVTVYNRYTGSYNGKQVVDFKFLDPLQNPDVKLKMKVRIQTSALQEDDKTWTPWKTIGIFYASDIKINDDRTTAVLHGNDKLATVFNKTLPSIPVYRNMRYHAFMSLILAQYKLPLNWEGIKTEESKFAFLQSTIKDTLQSLVNSAAAVAHIRINDAGTEELHVRTFTEFEGQVPYSIIDYSKKDAPSSFAQFFTLRYNKTLQSYSDNTRIKWYLPSVPKLENTTMYSFATEDLDDFKFNTSNSRYEMNISRTSIAPTPMNNLDYISVCSEYDTDSKNVSSGVHQIKATQHTFTGTAYYNMDEINEGYEYTVTVAGHAVNSESQIYPEETVDSEVTDMTDYLTADLKYVHHLPVATHRQAVLSTWASLALQTTDVDWRYNPYIELGDSIFIDAQVYDIDDFTGILWSQNITYTEGGLRSSAQLVNVNAFVNPLQIHDVTAYRNYSDDKISKFYIVGARGYTQGIWRVDAATYTDTTTFELVRVCEPTFTAAAIAFDGDWLLRTDIYTLITEEVPWLFTIESKKLYGDYNGNRTQLASSVVYCTAERGYFPRDYADLDSDQGLIVAYIKTDGKVYYRTYVVTASGKTWLAEEPLSDVVYTGVKDIQIQRLNDYRIGVVVTTTTKTYWLLSDRSYSQMAFRPEYFEQKMPQNSKPTLVMLRSDKVNATPQPNFTWSLSDDRTTVTIVSDMTLSNDATLQSRITGTASMPSVSTVKISGKAVIITFSKAATATFTITVTTGRTFYGYVPDQLKNVSGGYVQIDTISHEFEIAATHDYSDNFYQKIPTMRINEAYVVQVETSATQQSDVIKQKMPDVSTLAIKITDARETTTIDQYDTINQRMPSLYSATATITGVGIAPV